MTATDVSQLSIIADALAAGQLRFAVDAMKQTLEAEPAMRSTDGLARLHREVIQHKGVVARLERDSAARQMTREDERHERARLAAVLLDVLDDMTLIEAKLGIAFRVEAPVADSLPSAPGDTRPGPLGAEPADIDVFLSYARADRAHIVDLAVALQGRGCAAWFDHFITGGARFGEIINARLDAARAVVVLWSENSIGSDWVLYEADRAHKAGKLVPLRLPELALDRVPAPYPAVLNIIAHGDDDALTRALERLGLLQAPQ
jgi:hypothetical protein